MFCPGDLYEIKETLVESDELTLRQLKYAKAIRLGEPHTVEAFLNSGIENNAELVDIIEDTFGAVKTFIAHMTNAPKENDDSYTVSSESSSEDDVDDK
ncbi:hypothetical protein KAT92_04495, partial [Candidatus Babeliales bacterium]|nr:hypothetical protein [Candidatus Babeliales bacterium]